MRAKDKRVYLKNREAILERKRKWRQANKELVKARKAFLRARPEAKAKEKIRRAAYRAAHLEQEKAKQKEWVEKNKAALKAKMDEYYSRPDVIERVKAYRKKRYAENRDELNLKNREWRKKNSARIIQQQRNRIAKDPKAHYARVREWKKNNLPLTIAERMRSRIRDGITRSRTKKAAKTSELIGCTFVELIAHLASLFKPGMSWENYGLHGWHVDHKRPCASFDLTDPAQQRACFHYTNLQPLWALENRVKGDRYVPDVEIAV